MKQYQLFFTLVSLIVVLSSAQAREDFGDAMMEQILKHKGTSIYFINQTVQNPKGESAENIQEQLKANSVFLVLESSDNATVSGALTFENQTVKLSDCGTNEILRGLNQIVCSTDGNSKLVLSFSQLYRIELEEKEYASSKRLRHFGSLVGF